MKATDELGRVFVIEAQIVVHSIFAKRAVVYACEAYTDQLRADQGYSDLKAMSSIRFVDDVFDLGGHKTAILTAVIVRSGLCKVRELATDR